MSLNRPVRDRSATTGAAPFSSLVAEHSAENIGHIRFTLATIETDREQWRALALGSMAVHPDHQRCRIGSTYLRHVLDVCRSQEHDIVLVL